MNALITEDNGHLVKLHEVPRHRHRPALVATVSTKGVQFVPQQGVVIGAKIDGRVGPIRRVAAALEISKILCHGFRREK